MNAPLPAGFQPDALIPLAVLAPVCALPIGAGQSLPSPVGYPSGPMQLGAGRYRFLDIPCHGLPLTLPMTLEVPFAIRRQFSL